MEKKGVVTVKGRVKRKTIEEKDDHFILSIFGNGQIERL